MNEKDEHFYKILWLLYALKINKILIIKDIIRWDICITNRHNSIQLMVDQCSERGKRSPLSKDFTVEGKCFISPRNVVFN